MSELSRNPWDETVWDPTDPEQAIEDPLHGSEAVLGLLSIPPYLNDDGTYHVFGGLYVCGTTSFDAEGRPFVRIGSGNSFHTAKQDSQKHMEWVTRWRAGKLPRIEEMDYPAFQLEATPYIVIDNPAR